MLPDLLVSVSVELAVIKPVVRDVKSTLLPPVILILGVLNAKVWLSPASVI